MIGLFMIFVMGVVLALHIIVPILFSKLGKDNGKKQFIFGSLGFLLVFSLFFGDHVVRKVQHQYLCTFKAKNVVYDNKFFKTSNKEETITIKNHKEIEVMLKEFNQNIMPDNILFYKNLNIGLFDYSSSIPKNESLGKINIIKKVNFNNNKVIWEHIDYNISCGWLFNKLNISTGSCGFGSCKKDLEINEEKYK